MDPETRSTALSSHFLLFTEHHDDQELRMVYQEVDSNQIETLVVSIPMK